MVMVMIIKLFLLSYMKSGLPGSNRRHFDIFNKPLQSNALPTELNPGFLRDALVRSSPIIWTNSF